MQIEEQKDLTALNSLGFGNKAERYVEVADHSALNEAVAYANRQNWPVFVLGGGSNLVITQNIPGLVIKLTNDIISYDNRGEENSWMFIVNAGAGVNWHRLVRDSISRGLSGLENLSLIPGNTGAAPVQNIGAYGVELTDRFDSLTALHLPTNKWREFSKAECEFAYRDSFFKHHTGEYAITDVRLLLGSDMALETSYESLNRWLQEKHAGETVTPELISDAVCTLRQSKLPDPATIGNVGSFFHNPVVSQAQYDGLKQRYPKIIAYPQENGLVKLAAGWMIDSLGMRGNRKGAVGVHDRQALVLVHHGGGSGLELLAYASDIQQSVLDKFGVSLSMEPTVV